MNMIRIIYILILFSFLLIGCQPVIPSSKVDPVIQESIAPTKMEIKEMTGVYISGNYAYITNVLQENMYDNKKSKGSFNVIDISDPKSPIILGSVNTRGVFSVYVKGNYAYLSDGEIVDVSNPKTLSVVSSFDSGHYVYGYGNYVYVLTSLSYFDGNTGDFKIIDISNPKSPFIAGSAFIDYPVNRLFIRDNYAYFAANNYLYIMDISNIKTPFIVGKFKTDEVVYVYNLFVSGNYAYIISNKGLKVIDISNPKDPSAIGSLNGDWDSKVFVSGDYAYIPAWGKLNVIDISNPKDPSIVSSFSCFDDSAVGSDLYVKNNYVYLLRYSELKIIDVSNPKSPSIVTSISAKTLADFSNNQDPAKSN